MVVVLVALVGLSYLLVTQPWSAESRHRRLNQGIQQHFVQAEEPFRHYDVKHESFQVDTARMSKPDRGRYEIIRAVHTALGNWPFAYSKNVVPEKFAAIGARLDANGGADLKTFEGCCELLVLLNGASPEFHDYPWITQLYEMEKGGEIPPLPKLGPPSGGVP